MITFVIPVKPSRNPEEAKTLHSRLNATVNSIVRQTNPDWSIIIVSDNKVSEIQHDTKIRVVSRTLERVVKPYGDGRDSIAIEDASTRRFEGVLEAVKEEC